MANNCGVGKGDAYAQTIIHQLRNLNCIPSDEFLPTYITFARTSRTSMVAGSSFVVNRYLEIAFNREYTGILNNGKDLFRRLRNNFIHKMASTVFRRGDSFWDTMRNFHIARLYLWRFRGSTNSVRRPRDDFERLSEVRYTTTNPN